MQQIYQFNDRHRDDLRLGNEVLKETLNRETAKLEKAKHTKEREREAREVAARNVNQYSEALIYRYSQ